MKNRNPALRRVTLFLMILVPTILLIVDIGFRYHSLQKSAVDQNGSQQISHQRAWGETVLVTNLLYQDCEKGVLFGRKNHADKLLAIAFVMYVNIGEITDQQCVLGGALKDDISTRFDRISCKNALAEMMSDVGKKSVDPITMQASIKNGNGCLLFTVCNGGHLASHPELVKSDELDLDACIEQFLNYIYG